MLYLHLCVWFSLLEVFLFFLDGKLKFIDKGLDEGLEIMDDFFTVQVHSLLDYFIVLNHSFSCRINCKRQ